MKAGLKDEMTNFLAQDLVLSESRLKRDESKH